MQSDRWRRIEEVYYSALERDEASRLEFLDRACEGDPALRREVISLLARDAPAEKFLERPALETVRPAAEAPFDPRGMIVSHYRVIEQLGAGGMGVVYRASDIRLGRDVALKFLPERLSNDPDSLQRFKREARASSALNHPNICTIHDIGEHDGRPFIVMELLEGTTLKQRMHGRAIPESETLNIAAQIAAALEAAHAKGIVHRDIKPANIFITGAGHVKVLDFGLAKLSAHDVDPSGDVTANQTLSTPGFALGTLPYMSPEQLTGKPVDKRTDIWAFGCVLFEMLTGKMPFARETQAETSAAILDREPDWSLVPAGTSAELVRLMRRCLEKDAGRRLHDIGDARIEIHENDAGPRRVARFGVFELDMRSGELRRNGVLLKIQEQPFRLLAFLLERAGDVVTRDELRERLWPEHFVDFDHSLNAAIRKLREVLDDSAQNPRFIETLARRGYRFIAPVAWEGEAEPPPSPSPLPPPKRPMWIPIAAVAVLLLAAVTVSIILRQRPTVAAPNTIDAVAVLPFANDDPQTQPVSDGLAEILIDNLSRLPDLRVMARTTVFGFKGKDPRAAGRALNVNAVVAGNFQHRGNDYVIHVEMIDVKDGTQLWGSRFDATDNTLSAVQSDMSDVLAMQLRRGVSREQRRIAAQRYSADPRAYDAYLSGLYAWNKRDVENAVRGFSEAVERDPKFAQAYAGLANAYGAMIGAGAITVPEGTVKVMTAAQKALELDPNNASALVSIATSKFKNLWDFKGADADYRRALTINPNYATGHQWYAGLLRATGRWEEASLEIEIARRLDPRSWPINNTACFELYYERRYRDAIEFTHRLAQTDPKLASPICLSWNLQALGDRRGALSALEGLKVPVASWQQIITASRLAGPEGDFRKSAELLEKSQSDNIDTPVEIAEFYALAGERDRTFAWLEKGYQRRVSSMTDINTEPLFDSVRSDPRFDDLLRRIGLPKVNPPALH